MSQVWLITGSSRGVGRALAEAVLEKGHKLIATARNPAQLDDLVKRYGDNVRAVALDVTDAAAARTAVKAATDAFGRLDVLVNNAGYGDVASFEDMPDEVFRAQIETNFFGVVNVTKAALPVMRAQRSGHIIQVSSVGGRLTTPGLSAYQSAKWAVGGFSGVLAKETAPLGIKVTVLEPGGMRTDWAGSSMKAYPSNAAYDATVGAMAKFRENFTGKENGDPKKVADAILHIATLDDPPLRLLMGNDAVHLVEADDEARVASDKKWRDLSLSIDFEPGLKREYPWQKK